MTYAISDLHGRYDLYLEMLKRIQFSPEDTLYILGDVADRNKGGIQIYKDILNRGNVSLLMGNHERMLLRALQDPNGISLNGHESNRELWYRNGGEITEKEFRIEAAPVQRRLLAYLEELPLNVPVAVNETRFLLVHAMPVSLYEKYGVFYDDYIDFTVWERIEPWMNIEFSADVMICGHTPTAYYQQTRPMEICQVRENVYDIDCGCASGQKRGGRLGCMRLEDLTEFYVG